MPGINIATWEKFVGFMTNTMKGDKTVSVSFQEISREIGATIKEVRSLIKIFLSFNDFKTLNFSVSGESVNLSSEVKSEVISLKISDYESLSDIIYLFKNIRKGKGFEINADPANSLIQKILNLFERHPYFFRKLNGFAYPSELGYKLGVEALSFKRSNQIPENLSVLDYHFKIER